MTNSAKNVEITDRVSISVDIRKGCTYTLFYQKKSMDIEAWRNKMVSQKVIFQCEEALQMKAVAVLIQKSSSFSSSIYLIRDGRRANAKSLLGVMSLGIENGASIEIAADGPDESEAIKTLVEYLNNPKLA